MKNHLLNQDCKINFFAKGIEFEMNRSRPKQIVIRLSEEEFARVKKKVKKSGLKQQEYLIQSIFNTKIVNTDGLKEILPELKRQGVNLNQLVKKLNETGYIDYKKELPEIEKELKQVWQSLKQYLQKPV